MKYSIVFCSFFASHFITTASILVDGGSGRNTHGTAHLSARNGASISRNRNDARVRLERRSPTKSRPSTSSTSSKKEGSKRSYSDQSKPTSSQESPPRKKGHFHEKAPMAASGVGSGAPWPAAGSPSPGRIGIGTRPLATGKETTVAKTLSRVPSTNTRINQQLQESSKKAGPSTDSKRSTSHRPQNVHEGSAAPMMKTLKSIDLGHPKRPVTYRPISSNTGVTITSSFPATTQNSATNSRAGEKASSMRSNWRPPGVVAGSQGSMVQHPPLVMPGKTPEYKLVLRDKPTVSGLENSSLHSKQPQFNPVEPGKLQARKSPLAQRVPRFNANEQHESDKARRTVLPGLEYRGSTITTGVSLHQLPAHSQNDNVAEALRAAGWTGPISSQLKPRLDPRFANVQLVKSPTSGTPLLHVPGNAALQGNDVRPGTLQPSPVNTRSSSPQHTTSEKETQLTTLPFSKFLQEWIDDIDLPPPEKRSSPRKNEAPISAGRENNRNHPATSGSSRASIARSRLGSPTLTQSTESKKSGIPKSRSGTAASSPQQNSPKKPRLEFPSPPSISPGSSLERAVKARSDSESLRTSSLKMPAIPVAQNPSVQSLTPISRLQSATHSSAPPSARPVEEPRKGNVVIRKKPIVLQNRDKLPRPTSMNPLAKDEPRTPNSPSKSRPPVYSGPPHLFPGFADMRLPRGQISRGKQKGAVGVQALSDRIRIAPISPPPTNFAIPNLLAALQGQFAQGPVQRFPEGASNLPFGAVQGPRIVTTPQIPQQVSPGGWALHGTQAGHPILQSPLFPVADSSPIYRHIRGDGRARQPNTEPVNTYLANTQRNLMASLVQPSPQQPLQIQSPTSQLISSPRQRQQSSQPGIPMPQQILMQGQPYLGHLPQGNQHAQELAGRLPGPRQQSSPNRQSGSGPQGLSQYQALLQAGLLQPNPFADAVFQSRQANLRQEFPIPAPPILAPLPPYPPLQTGSPGTSVLPPLPNPPPPRSGSPGSNPAKDMYSMWKNDPDR